ncbi:hypothetical protein [Saccharopolyspora sp. NPDC002376]
MKETVTQWFGSPMRWVTWQRMSSHSDSGRAGAAGGEEGDLDLPGASGLRDVGVRGEEAFAHPVPESVSDDVAALLEQYGAAGARTEVFGHQNAPQ